MDRTDTNKDYYYRLTKYPKIYENIYWGRFKNDKHKIDTNIIENRNKFIEEYNIKSGKKFPQYVWKYIYQVGLNLEYFHTKKLDYYSSNIFHDHTVFDHKETYITKTGDFILICSPYKGSKEFEIFDKFGFKEIYPLYLNSATTYLLIIKK